MTSSALLTENRIFKCSGNVDIGIVNRAEAEMWGMSGVMLRSTALACTGICAAAGPMSARSELDFKILIGKNGDNYDRRRDAHGRNARSPPRS